MKRLTFVLKLSPAKRAEQLAALAARKLEIDDICTRAQIENFSLWHIEEYVFGYGENASEDMHAFDAFLAALPEGVEVVCMPGSMRLMYHCIGIVRADKSLIRHRVFVTKLKPGCEEEYKRRHDGLIAARAGKVIEGPESDFTIWYGDGHIFGYCELVKAFDHEPTAQEHAATVAWETRQLGIMDWLTDDMDWLTGEKHPAIERVL